VERRRRRRNMNYDYVFESLNDVGHGFSVRCVED
jgi:hypothetical protein